MIYDVPWEKAAESQLLGVSLRAADRPAVWRAANAINRQLERNPTAAGESRWGEYRVFIVRPLSVVYRIDEAERKVVVEGVRWAGI